MPEIQMSAEAFKYFMPLTIIGSLVAVFGCVGNVFTLMFLKTKERKMGATKILLMAIAIFDTTALTISLVNFCLSRLLTSNNPWTQKIFYDSYSVLINCMVRFPKYCSNVTLLVISVERLLCVAIPHKLKLIFTRNVCLAVVIAIPILCLLMVIPNALEFESVTTNSNVTGTVHVSLRTTGFANRNKTLFMSINIISLIVVICMPIFGITICNIALVTILSRKKMKLNSYKEGGKVHEMKTTKIVLAITIIFVLCVSPLGIYVPLRGMTDISMSPFMFSILINVSTFLQNINYSANCIVYMVGSAKFREYICNVVIWRCKCTVKRPNKVSPTQPGNTEEHPPGATSTRTGTDDIVRNVPLTQTSGSSERTNTNNEDDELF